MGVAINDTGMTKDTIKFKSNTLNGSMYLTDIFNGK